MRAVLAVILVVGVGWSAIWFFGARAVDRNLTAWLDQRHSAGWMANYSEVRTRGYPNRFDTTLSDIELADPGTGLAWTAPFFQIFRLSYQPRHAIVVWPETQTIATPDQRIEIESTSARGSFVFQQGDLWPLESATTVFEGLRLTSTADWTAEIETMRLATRPSERVEGAIDVGFEAQAFSPASAAIQQLSDMGIVPRTLERLRVDASLTFDAPWDRRAIEVGRPVLEAIELHRAEAIWGELELWAAGRVTLDGQGRASGEVTLKFKNWREMLELAKTTGWIGDRLIGPIERAFEVLSGLAGSSKTLDVPLTLRDGRATFGPIPIGTLPEVRLR
ncbi:MAG: DUF2125 domain-containing protein [Pseudomonadota bacterium]